MKNLLLISILLIFSTINNLSANITIVFVDIDAVLSTSKPGLNILKQLDDIKSKNLKEFDKKKEELKKKENKLVAQKNILTPENFQVNVNELKLEIKQYNDDRNNKIKNYQIIRSDNIKKLLELINPILQKYSVDESISMILRKNNLVIGKADHDITKPIIELVNKNIKIFKIK
jgi:Skp family chaperone for outer membrane proteins